MGTFSSSSPLPRRMLSNFHLQALLRVVLLACNLGALIWTMLHTMLYATMSILFILCILQMWMLVRFVEQTNRHLIRFLESVRYGDTIQMREVARLGHSYSELTDAFAAVVEDFERIRTEKEEQYLALQTLLHHVSIALISFDEHGMVDFINPAARRLLGLTHIRSLTTLKIHHPSLYEALYNIPKNRKILVKLVQGDEILQLILSATVFRQRGTEMTLVSLQNIINELEEQEIIAWQKLIRVLTHEIMNSVTPITSLAETVSGLLARAELSQKGDEEVRRELLNDVRDAVGTIARRSAGLLAFVENYRILSRIPEPNFEIVRIEHVFRDVTRLFEQEASERGIRLSWSVESVTLDVAADRALLEQVFINLIKNAIQAMPSGGSIVLHASQTSTGRTLLTVQDTGSGIAPEALEKIFIPFFTTKPEGSGIGLSFARQALLKHNATLSVHSEIGKGTTFTVKF